MQGLHAKLGLFFPSILLLVMFRFHHGQSRHQWSRLIRQDAAGHIHHHLHAFKQLALELIALKACLVIHEWACIANNFNWMFGELFLKTSSISCFPDCPADHRHPKGVYFTTIWKPFCNPGPVLSHIGWHISSPKAHSHHTPYNLSYWALKKKMWGCFSLFTKKHVGSPTHFLLTMLSFIRIELFSSNQRKIFILYGILLFQILVKLSPTIISGQIVMYRFDSEITPHPISRIWHLVHRQGSYS